MFLIAGPPGAGKTTQSKKLAASYGLTLISVGDLMRAKAGPKEQEIMQSGGLIPDSYVHSILAAEMDLYDDQYKLLIDGFPRNFHEARWLIDEYGANISAYIILQVSDEIVEQRLEARARQDDTPEAIAERLEIFHTETDSIIQYFEEQMIPVVHIDGTQEIDAVQDELIDKLGLEE